MKHILTLLTTVLLLLGPTTHANVDDEFAFSEAELDSILAPIALYPDTVLSHILIAATYPLEVVEATRWAQQQEGLSSEEILLAAELQGWDPSVQALTPFPQLLNRMSEDLQWTQKLGDAFLQSEARVLDSIQKLRQRAYNEGNLESNDYQEVEYSEGEIIIEPTRTKVVYVPYYDTRVVYGSWWWPTYPPSYWAYRPIHGRPSFRIGFAWWAPGFYLGSGVYFGGFHWHHRQVVVVHHARPHHYSRHHVTHYQQTRRWVHNPLHRRGVHYRTPRLAERYHSSRPAHPRLSVHNRGDSRSYSTQHRQASREQHERLVRHMRDPKGYRNSQANSQGGNRNSHGDNRAQRGNEPRGERHGSSASQQARGNAANGGRQQTHGSSNRNNQNQRGSNNSSQRSGNAAARTGGGKRDQAAQPTDRSSRQNTQHHSQERSPKHSQQRSTAGTNNERKARSQTEQWRQQAASPKYQQQNRGTSNYQAPKSSGSNQSNKWQRSTQQSSATQRSYSSNSNRSYSAGATRHSSSQQSRASASSRHSGASRASQGGRNEHRSR